MTIRGQVPTEPFATSPNDKAGHAVARCIGDAAVITPIRHKLRAIASESGSGKRLHAAKLLRPLVAQAHDILREHFEAGGSAEDYLCDRAKLADSAVVGLLHIASISNGIRNQSMVAPLAAIAVGGYGRRELAPGSDLDLLFMLPENSRGCTRGVVPATKSCISEVIAGLWDLGFKVDHAARSASECLELARGDAIVLAGLIDRRFLWGGFGLLGPLDREITALLSGPSAGRWREVIGEALSGTYRPTPQIPVVGHRPDRNQREIPRR
jgi:UTP:GlnB (protein PII) uridylyltransferase